MGTQWRIAKSGDTCHSQWQVKTPESPAKLWDGWIQNHDASPFIEYTASLAGYADSSVENRLSLASDFPFVILWNVHTEQDFL